MRSKVAAAIALSLALAATTASAGVVISQDMTVTNQVGSTRKSARTVMVQGHKQKVIDSDRVIITDLDAGKMYLMSPSTRSAVEGPFPPVGVFATMMMNEGAFVGFTKTGGSRKKLDGYDCEDYWGGVVKGHYKIGEIECVASAAAGAAEFAAFRKAMAEKLKRTPLEIKGEIPDGIPVASRTEIAVNPARIPPGFSPEQVAKINAARAKAKPEIRTIGVTKIEVKDIPADEFVVPADFNKRQQPPPSAPVVFSKKPGSPAVPVVPAAPSPH